MKYINLNFNYKKATLKKTSVLLGAIIIGTSISGCTNKPKDVESDTNTYKVEDNNKLYKPNKNIEEILKNNETKTQEEDNNISTNKQENNNISTNKQENNNTSINKQQNNNNNQISEHDNNVELKNVALTFDDGPSIYTDDLLDILKENNIKATFFLTGENIVKYPDVVKRMYTEGHSIGLHGFSHTSFNKLGIRETRNEIDICDDLLNQLGVKWNRLVRPPYGELSNDIKNNVAAPFILWSVDTRDWESRNTNSIVQEINNDIFGGSIILMHDLYPTSVEAIKEILPEYKNKYNFVTVDALYNNKLENNKVYSKK